MLSAEDFAKVLGTSRVTVNTNRQNGQVLGLDGAKRGFRFPLWQLDSLGSAWAVYRFLVQPQRELDGLTRREGLARGRSRSILQAAESVARDFR